MNTRSLLKGRGYCDIGHHEKRVHELPIDHNPAPNIRNVQPPTPAAKTWERVQSMAKHRKVLNTDGVAEEIIKRFDKMNDGSGMLGALWASLITANDDLNPTIRSSLEDAMTKAIQRIQRDLNLLQGVVSLEPHSPRSSLLMKNVAQPPTKGER
jgi:hypothetical protein